MLITKKITLKEKPTLRKNRRLDNTALAKNLGVNISTIRKYQIEIGKSCPSYIQENGIRAIFTIEKQDIDIARAICLQNKYNLETEYTKNQINKMIRVATYEKDEVKLLEEIIKKVCGEAYRQIKMSKTMAYVVNKKVFDQNKEKIRIFFKAALKKLAS